MTEIIRNSIPLFLGLFLLMACKPDAPKDKPSISIAPDSKEIVKEEVAETPAKITEPVAVKEEKAPEKTEETKSEKVEEKPKPKPKPKKRPKIAFNAKTFDYGVIMQGDKVEHEFKFTNKGNANLLITNVSASCGCTKPTYPFIPIKPGEEGSIGVVFDSKGKLGRSIPTITVVTNARPTTYKLKLTGFVDAEREKEKPAAGEKTPEIVEEGSSEEGS